MTIAAQHHINNILPILENYELVAEYLRENGIPSPKARTRQGFKARLVCKRWWRRTLHRLDCRSEEAKQIEGGRVGRNRQKYASDMAVARVAKKMAESAEFLRGQVMLSDHGDQIDMDKIIESSVANPANRRAEFMIRVRGFEDCAKKKGYVGEFYTITCPSPCHRLSGDNLNSKYKKEMTPREAQRYLVSVWSRIRAAYGRQGIRPFGFRVAEPHRDGCPHWHLLLFVRPEQREQLRNIIAHYALEIDGNEPGAQRHRFKYVEIDPAKGSAAGYVAKYISKNMGFSIDDQEDEDAYSQRVKAWASCWGIRQFQQIGGASVMIWRELRKLREKLDDELLEAARKAADESRWSDYLELSGGVDVGRDERTINLVKAHLVDKKNGEVKQNRYRERVEVIIGVASLAAEAITKIKNWVMLSREAAGSAFDDAGSWCFRTWSPVNNCTLVV